jgi:dTDP-4-amino-4,6-dideoxygalactose transaminase
LIEAAITPRTKAIMPVHLYGQSADMTAISEIARAHNLQIIEDAAQAHGTNFLNKRCGTYGLAGCFSFYPGKNLGAYGDGGAIVTNNDEFAEKTRRLRNYGQQVKYIHVEQGTNSRLDSVQAAVLNVKLRHLDDWNAARAAHAAVYSDSLAHNGVIVPTLDSRSTHIFHLYVIRTTQREQLQSHLAARGVQTGIHYPVPIHLQQAYSDLGLGKGSFPTTEKLADEILSLPLFAELSEKQIEAVIEGVSTFKGNL